MASQKTTENEGDLADGENVDRAALHQAQHDGQHDQAEHVVDNRGADQDLALPGVELADVLQHLDRDRDAGGSQRRAHQECLVVRVSPTGSTRP